MKKFLTILAISCTSLLLSGCFGGDESDVEIESSYNTQSFVGVVADLPADSSVNATHILNADTGDTVYLRSVLFDLGDFVGGKLRVSGTMEEKEDGTKVLLVESRDVLELDIESDEPYLFEFEEQGFEIELPESKYEISDSASLVNFVTDDYSFSVRSIVKGLELDMEIYLDENYDDQIPQDVLFSNNRYYKLNLGTGRSVYLHNSEDVIYEIIFNSDGSNQAELNLEINEVLDNIFYTPETMDIETTVEIDTEADKDNDEDNQSDQDDSDTEPGVTQVEPVDLSSLSGEVSGVVSGINSSKSALVGADASIFNYSITDNDYVYVSYENDEAEYRKLFKINGANFEEIAYFEEGSETDWELVSGENIAYDRPLKMVFVEEDGYRQVDVKEGYRYFESRPMLLGFHYPRQWYYAGGNNTYEFSDKPLTEGETLVKIEMVDDSFDSLNGVSISPTIKKTTVGSEIRYYVEKEDGDVILLSADSEYSEELDIMAQTLVEVSE